MPRSQPHLHFEAQSWSYPPYFFVPYGDWLVGFSGMRSSLALLYTAFSVRPSFSPITLVGVLCLARSRKFETSFLDHSFPVFLVYFGIILTSSFFYSSLTLRITT